MYEPYVIARQSQIDWCPKAGEPLDECGKIRSFDALAASNVGCLHLFRCRGVEPKDPDLLHRVIVNTSAQAPGASLYLAASYRRSNRYYKSSGFSPGSVHVSFPLSDTSLMPATVRILCYDTQTRISVWISLLGHHTFLWLWRERTCPRSHTAHELWTCIYLWIAVWIEASTASGALYDSSS